MKKEKPLRVEWFVEQTLKGRKTCWWHTKSPEEAAESASACRTQGRTAKSPYRYRAVRVEIYAVKGKK